MNHGRQPEVEFFLFWYGFASHHGQGRLLFWCLWLDGTNVMALKRSKKGNIQFPVSVRGSKTSVLRDGPLEK